VFRMELNPGISANPYVVFSTVATETGELVFTWTDQKGAATVERKQITVTG
jgi:sulfur-oxidizing protein SoxZ